MVWDHVMMMNELIEFCNVPTDLMIHNWSNPPKYSSFDKQQSVKYFVDKSWKWNCENSITEKMRSRPPLTRRKSPIRYATDSPIYQPNGILFFHPIFNHPLSVFFILSALDLMGFILYVGFCFLAFLIWVLLDLGFCWEMWKLLHTLWCKKWTFLIICYRPNFFFFLFAGNFGWLVWRTRIRVKFVLLYVPIISCSIVLLVSCTSIFVAISCSLS